ncbi:MAG: hypothetical protein GY847_09335 [Proteobacteria bacterium]|nr:hypothetical protein [Pseudomonadota bacterium]
MNLSRNVLAGAGRNYLFSLISFLKLKGRSHLWIDTTNETIYTDIFSPFPCLVENIAEV